MSVAAQHQIHGLTCRVSEQLVRVIGGVTHKNHWLVGHVANGFRDRRSEIWIAANHIVEPRQPYPASVAFEGQIRISQHNHSIRRQSCRDVFLSQESIVIAENCVTLLALKSAEHFSALPCGFRSVFLRCQLIRYVIPGQKYDVRLQPIDVLDRIMKQKWLGEFIQVDVAQLRSYDPRDSQYSLESHRALDE